MLMLDELKRAVCAANLRLVAEGLVFQTWGNVSAVDRAAGVLVIKASGVPYEGMGPEHMVVVSLETGKVVEGELRPSSDMPTHLELYRAWPAIGGVAHTHSLYATAWAQASREIPPLGTTHADFCATEIPVTRRLKPEEIRSDYEANTGRIIVERFARLDPVEVPAVLVSEHGPFTWGADAAAAVTAAAVLERVAHIASETLHIEPHTKPVEKELLDRHYRRKHGPGAYYGQE
jgi:L-ribulose-5-phosphate 4-epimerase